MSNAVAWLFWGALPAFLLRVLVEQVRANARKREWSAMRERQAVKDALR